MGNRIGGMKALDTLVEKYGKTPDGKSAHHARIGAMGGSWRSPDKGFGSMNKADVIAAGRKGGTISRRGKSTEAQRQHQSEAMKASWAARKADQA